MQPSCAQKRRSAMSCRPPLAVCCTHLTEAATPDGAQHSCAAAGSQCCDAPELAAPPPTFAGGHTGRPRREAGRDSRGSAPPSPHQFLLLPQRSRGVRHLFFVKPHNNIFSLSKCKCLDHALFLQTWSCRLVSQQLTSHPQFKNIARLRHIASMQSLYR